MLRGRREIPPEVAGKAAQGPDERKRTKEMRRAAGEVLLGENGELLPTVLSRKTANRWVRIHEPGELP